jgi:hypothetical protein
VEGKLLCEQLEHLIRRRTFAPGVLGGLPSVRLVRRHGDAAQPYGGRQSCSPSERPSERPSEAIREAINEAISEAITEAISEEVIT